MSKIFLDKSKLSPRYLPDNLLHRSKQIEIIKSYFSTLFTDPEKFPLTIIQIIGNTGVGKTSTLIKSSKIIENNFINRKYQLKIGYINLKLQGGNKFTIYKYLLEKIAPEIPSQGLSAEEMLRLLLRYLHKNNIFLILILDEIDYLIRTTKDNGIIYDLTRINEFEPNESYNLKGVIFIARSTEFYEKLDQAERSTLGRFPIEFPPYNLEQIAEIISVRCDEAFQPKVVGPEIIDEISKITFSNIGHGDIRYALDLLLYAGNLAELDSFERINLEHIYKVKREFNPAFDQEQIMNLSINHIITLIAITKILKLKKRATVKLKEIRNEVEEFQDVMKPMKFDLEDSLDYLQLLKIIKINSLNEIAIIDGISEIQLQKILDLKIKSKKR